MGAIAVAPSDSNTIYAGTGEANLGPSKAKREFRDNIYYGLGVLKSTDGGTTWSNTTASISTTAAFSDLVMDPSDRMTLYAAVGEPGWDAGNGVYKPSDAGASWHRLMFGGV